MKKQFSHLRLGPLPKTEIVKVTISLTADMKAMLDDYASLHSQLNGKKVDAVALIPHMLEAFVRRDRGFKSLVSTSATPRAAAVEAASTAKLSP